MVHYKAIQGGAGTSINMNMNEVIANRSAQLKTLPMGRYTWIHPNDHVNHAQSTNDVFPTAGKITAIYMVNILLEKLEEVENTLSNLAKYNDDVVKVGRTHLQDAVLITMGQVFRSFESVLARNRKWLKHATSELYAVNLGATAVGTEISTRPGYRFAAIKHLAEITKLSLESASDLVDGTKHVDGFNYIHSCLRLLAMDLSKLCNDMRLMASGPTAGLVEISLPAVQPGSSIMPGKVNPVVLEVVNQACFQIFGHDATIVFAHEVGQMELNVFEPVIFYNLFKSLRIMTNALTTLNDKALKGLVVNRAQCERQVGQSLAMATSLVEYLGYDKVSKIAKNALKRNVSLREIILEEELLSEQVLDEVLNPIKMIRR